MKIAVDVIELPHRTIHDPGVEFTYFPGDPGDRENAPTLEGAEIHNIYDAGVKVPYNEWLDQEEDIERLVLAEIHKESWSCF